MDHAQRLAAAAAADNVRRAAERQAAAQARRDTTTKAAAQLRERLQAEAAAAKAQLEAMRDGFVTAGAPIDAARIAAEAARAEIERLTVTSHQRRACPARCCRGGPVRR